MFSWDRTGTSLPMVKHVRYGIHKCYSYKHLQMSRIFSLEKKVLIFVKSVRSQKHTCSSDWTDPQDSFSQGGVARVARSGDPRSPIKSWI